jgi:hypothetical protein
VLVGTPGPSTASVPDSAESRPHAPSYHRAAAAISSWFLGATPPPVVPVPLIWMAPIYVGMLYDWITRRIVHPVYLIGIVAIVYMKFWRIPMYQSKAWDAFADWVTRFYA